jgi:predicted transcriptional regulator
MDNQIKKSQLVNLTKDCQGIINDHIEEHNLSVHAFAKLCGIHPNQLYLFLRGERGLNLTTMQRIGTILND